MAGAAVISAGLVGTFALPAYAAEKPIEIDGTYEQNGQVLQGSQTLETSESEGETVVLNKLSKAAPVNDDAYQDEKAEQEAKDAAAKEKAEQEAADAADAQAGTEESSETEISDVPSGEGAGAIVAAAKAQLGDAQDCTALVERSLRAAGIPAGDLGTSVGEYLALGGKQVNSYAPGDVLIWPGAHVAIYIGNGQAVHGGYNGTTVIASATGTSVGAPSAVVRF